jgi:hypothetical protein
MYDTEEGTTRLQNLRKRLGPAQNELTQAKRFIHSLRYSSDADAAGLLVRLELLVPAMPPAAEVHSRSECRAAQRILQLNDHRIGDAIG